MNNRNFEATEELEDQIHFGYWFLAAVISWAFVGALVLVVRQFI